MREKDQIENDKKLIKILRGYLELSNKAFSSHSNLEDLKNHYYGFYKDKKTSIVGNASNIIKPIVDTKITLILDNNITTDIIPKNISFANFERIKAMRDIADILNDCKTQVFEDNQIDFIKKEVVKSALICNNGIVQIYWDEEAKNGEGDIVIEFVRAENVFPDPNSKSLEDADYLFVKKSPSLISLKKKYPQYADDLDLVAAKANKKTAGESSNEKYVITTRTAESVQQKFYGTNSSIQNLDKTVDVYELYCKDDTIFIPEENDNELDEKEVQQAVQQLAFPEGRCIIFCGDNLVLEDKPMANPFVNFVNESTDQIFQPVSLVGDLVFLQERLNHAYYKLRDFMRKTLTLLALDGASGITPSDLINQDAILLNPYALRDGLAPQVVANNTIAGMNEVMQYIDKLKQQIYEIARINPMMISGEKTGGVTSGQQIAALNESPLTSIRESQKQFANFMVRLTNKVIKLVQSNYSLGRIVKLTTAEDQYAKIPLREEENGQNITIHDELGNEIKEIQGNLDIGEYAVKIIAGTEMPMSKTMYSNTTLQLVNLGVFDDPKTSIDSKKLILEALDYPNRREIIKQLEKKDQDMAEKPPAEPPIEKINLSFKDLEFFPSAQEKILIENGMLEPSAQPELPPNQPIPSTGNI